jgi:hypothetical protein
MSVKKFDNAENVRVGLHLTRLCFHSSYILKGGVHLKVKSVLEMDSTLHDSAFIQIIF